MMPLPVTICNQIRFKFNCLDMNFKWAHHSPDRVHFFHFGSFFLFILGYDFIWFYVEMFFEFCLSIVFFHFFLCFYFPFRFVENQFRTTVTHSSPSSCCVWCIVGPKTCGAAHWLFIGKYDFQMDFDSKFQFVHWSCEIHFRMVYGSFPLYLYGIPILKTICPRAHIFHSFHATFEIGSVFPTQSIAFISRLRIVQTTGVTICGTVWKMYSSNGSVWFDVQHTIHVHVCLFLENHGMQKIKAKKIISN